ncbi:class I SAM-dependent methyltransferase [Saccharothrix syringae]|uniref:Class I SAM-dependent methyltransferase n=1 Tax=Saccharothrix syringae TaxID=103733 RepID=A0A5Q0GYQ5_SACSY|nr:class I SAM-dependent methyltransferase [Saccharothrix syringae]QFZ18522.1 class I SAM-dependent methyltransferase [Saccharothrix syringae]
MTTARNPGSPVTDIEGVVQLYTRYEQALRVVREEQRVLHGRGARAQLDDVEAELTYLLIRSRRPAFVVEIGALDGWSTSWILRALRDNGTGRLLTLDRVANAASLVPPDLAGDRWEFRAGDARALPADWVAEAGYLFIDAEHSARFARWYLAEVLPRLAPGTAVSVHDVFRRSAFGRPRPSREGKVVLDWLAARGLGCFTAAPSAAPDVHQRIMQLRGRFGLTDPIHRGDRNPMIFFRLPGGEGRLPAAG